MSINNSILTLSKHANALGATVSTLLTAAASIGAAQLEVIPLLTDTTGGAGLAYGIATVAGLVTAAAAFKLTQIGLKRVAPIYVLKNATEKQKNNEAFVKSVTMINPDSVEHASTTLKERPAFMKTIVQSNPQMVKHASEKLRNDKTFMEFAAQKDPSTIEHATDTLKSDPEFMKKMAKLHIGTLTYAHESLLNKPVFMKELILENKEALKYAGEEITKDAETMIAIAEKYPKEAYEAADETLKANPKFMLPIILHDIKVLKSAEDGIKKDETTMIAIAEKYPKEAYKAADETLKANPKFMLPIAKNDLETLLGGDTDAEPLLQDLDFMKTLILHNRDALNYAEDSVLEDANTMVSIATELDKKISGMQAKLQESTQKNKGQISKDKKKAEEHLQSVYEKASESLRTHPDFMLPIVKHNINLLQEKDFPNSLLEDGNFMRGVRDVVLYNIAALKNADKKSADSIKAEKHLESVYKKASESLRTNPNFMLPIVKHDINLLQKKDFPNSLLEDVNFMKEVVLHNIKALENSGKKLSQDTEAMTAIASKYPTEALNKAPLFIKQNHGFALAVASKDPTLFSLLPDDVRLNKGFIIDCIKANPAIFAKLPESSKKNTKFVLELLKDSGRSEFFEFIIDSLKADKNFMGQAARINGNTFQFATTALKEDDKFIIEEIIRGGRFGPLISEKAGEEFFPHIACKLKQDKKFLNRIRNYPGILLSLTSDRDCADMIRQRSFFTKEEIQKIVQTCKTSVIKKLELQEGRMKDIHLITSFLAIYPDLIKEFTNPSDELIEEIAKVNYEVIFKLEPVIQNRFTENEDFIHRIAAKQPKVLFSIPPNGTIQNHSDRMYNTIAPFLRENKNKVSLLLTLGDNAKKDSELFSKLAEICGDIVYDYADDSIRESRSFTFGIGPQYQRKTIK